MRHEDIGSSNYRFVTRPDDIVTLNYDIVSPNYRFASRHDVIGSRYDDIGLRNYLLAPGDYAFGSRAYVLVAPAGAFVAGAYRLG